MTLRSVHTVRELILHLQACPADASVILVPEEGNGYGIGGVLQNINVKEGPGEVWLLIDEFGEVVTPTMDWSGVEDWEGERVPALPPEPPVEKPDVVKVRGKLRSA